MTICLLAACLLGAPPAILVELTPLDGSPLRGQLVQLAADEVSLSIDGEVRKWPAAAIEEVRFSPGLAEASPHEVVLADGSELRPARVTLARGKAQLDFGGQVPLEAPVKQVRSVLFKKQNPELSRQWTEIAKVARTSDVVVVRRKAPKPTGDDTKPAAPQEESLDFLEGTVTAITPETVEFDLGDDQSSLKRDKLEGVVFGRRGADAAAVARFRLLDVNGSRWNLTSFTADAQGLALELPSGVLWHLPAKEIAVLDFSPGNVIYLDASTADLTQTSFDLVPASLKTSLERLYKPLQITPASGERLRLGQQSFNRGLLLRGETRLVYQVPAGCQRFTAVAGLPSQASKQAHARLVVAVDGQAPWEQTLSFSERGPFVIDLPVSGAKRLTIRLEDTENLEISDQVLLCKARFQK